MIFSKGTFASAAFAALVLVSPNAGAADIDPVTGYPMYISVFGGAHILNDVETVISPGGFLPNYELSYDTKTGYLLGGAIGVKWNDMVRTEIELSYASAKAKTEDAQFGALFASNPVSGPIQSTYLLGNVWFDYSNDSAMTPYIGAGLGMGWADADVDGDKVVGLKNGSSGLAFQLGAGVKYDISETIAVDLGYRFKGLKDINFDLISSTPFEHKGDLYSHNVQLGLTIGF